MAEGFIEQTAPALRGPSDKEKKYDRQLRLWAAEGQNAIEEAHILLVNSGSGTVGAETLKNLVLPGIGRFTIADDAIVKEQDLGVNFFLDETSLGKLRSQCCATLLQELNPDVEGSFIKTQDLFKNDVIYTFIIYTHPIDLELLAALENYGQTNKIPLISINSTGFYSYFRVHLHASFPIVDTHPDITASTDLRLLSPWPELSAFARELTARINDLDAHVHGHIPYVVLLLHYLDEWKLAHGNEVPRTYSEKIAFRKMVSDGARKNNPEGGEENYDEAVAAVLKTVIIPSLSSSVKQVFSNAPNEAEAETSFWIIADAVKKFYEIHAALPLPGSVPDMKAQSDVYIRLQNIYKCKARQDVREIEDIVKIHPRGKVVESREIETFCKNAAFIKLIQNEVSDPSSLGNLADAELNAEFALSPTLIPIYLALKASEYKDGATQEEILSEISRVAENAARDERVLQAAQEVARANGGELHNISAVTGGMVAQEIIKIIAKQYIPIDNICVFDGITSRTQILKL